MTCGKKEEILDYRVSEIQQFYDGKSIFLTGAAGYLGVVLLETLLSNCPGIRRIYILLRPKNGEKPEDRKEKMFKREIFNKVKEHNPSVLRKVVVVPGDISQENLGMNDDDYLKITLEVSVVFHVAACVSFFKPLRYMMNHNVIGMSNVIDLCQKIKQLDALVYTSTLFSTCSSRPDVEEKIYKLPFKAEEAVTLTRKGDDDGLNSLFSKVQPINFYTFSKWVSENLLAEKAQNLPVSIIRASVIINCIGGSRPGYVEKGSALVNLCLAVGKGFIRVVQVDDNYKFESIPADIAANAHIVIPYLQATKRLPSPFICNCTSGNILPYSWMDWYQALVKMMSQHPLPDSYLAPDVILCKNPTTYKIYSVLYHYIPAFTLDTMLYISGSKFRLVKLYDFYERVLKKLDPIAKGQWIFGSENFVSLSDKLNDTDAEIFTVDLKGFSLEKLIGCLRTGAPIYLHNNKPYEETLINRFMRYFLTYLIKYSVLGSVASVFYLAIRMTSL